MEASPAPRPSQPPQDVPQVAELRRQGFEAIYLDVDTFTVGDGKTYMVKVGIAGQTWSYIQRFPTEAAVPRIYDLPIDGFEPVGKRLKPAPDAPPTMDPSTIDQLAVYVLDKQQGPFDITVTAIDATLPDGRQAVFVGDLVEGQARVDQKDCTSESIDVRRRIAYLPGDVRLFRNMNGHRFLKFMSQLRRNTHRERSQQPLLPVRYCRYYRG